MTDILHIITRHTKSLTFGQRGAQLFHHALDFSVALEFALVLVRRHHIQCFEHFFQLGL